MYTIAKFWNLNGLPVPQAIPDVVNMLTYPVPDGDGLFVDPNVTFWLSVWKLPLGIK